jgi:hypothetical protein
MQSSVIKSVLYALLHIWSSLRMRSILSHQDGFDLIHRDQLGLVNILIVLDIECRLE